MNKYIMYENSRTNIINIDQKDVLDIISIGAQIKIALGLRNNPIELTSANELQIGSIVGNIALNDTNIIIMPKCVEHYSDVDQCTTVVKKLYQRAVKCSTDSLKSTIYFSKTNVADDQDIIVDVLVAHFYGLLNNALKKSNISVYEEHISKTSTIRGKILVHKQLTHPATDEKTWCKYKSMTNNNVFNQLLYWCCHHLCMLTSNLDYKRKLLALSREFPQQIDLLNYQSVSVLKTPQRYSEYKEPIELAKSLYLNNCSKRENFNNGKSISGYAINMEQAFENIVSYYCDCASRILGLSHKKQAWYRLSDCKNISDLEVHVMPDDLIYSNGRYLIVDAKYKAISLKNAKDHRKPSREDFYQMISSCIAYNCNEAVLIYPYTNRFPAGVWNTDNDVNGKRIIIYAKSIDLLISDDLLLTTFIDIINDTSFLKENLHEPVFITSQ